MSKPLKFKSTARANVNFEGQRFSTGADSVSCILTTGSLHMSGSSPAASACEIVNRFNTDWDIKHLIDLKEVQKALKSKTTLRKLAAATNVTQILELLCLSEIAMLADYSELQAQTYVKGHILSEKLGGPGDDSNLTPMSASSNATYYRAFESKLINALKTAETEEKKAGYCVRIRFQASCKGAMKPWWGGATKETTRMLSRLPRTLVASYKLDSFFPKGQPGKSIAKTKLPESAKKHLAKTAKLETVSYTLAL